MKGITSEPISGPAPAAGILRFFDVSGGGPKISPKVVVGLCFGFIVFELIANVLF